MFLILTKQCAHHKHEVLPYFTWVSGPFFLVSEVLRLPRRWAWGIWSFALAQSDSRQFHKTRDSRAFQNIVQIHQILRLPQKTTSESASHFDPRLPRGWQSVRCPATATQTDVPDRKMSRKANACHQKWTWVKKQARHAGENASAKKELLRCKGHLICWTRMRPTWINTRP